MTLNEMNQYFMHYATAKLVDIYPVPFRITSLEDANSIAFTNSKSGELEYQVGSVWLPYIYGTGIPLNTGDSVAFRSTGDNSNAGFKFSAAKKFSVAGDIYSLVSPVDNGLCVKSENCFSDLFNNNKLLHGEIPRLVFKSHVYPTAMVNMFKATNVTGTLHLSVCRVEHSGFRGLCDGTKITKAIIEVEDVALLAERSFQWLFQNCRALTEIQVNFSAWPPIENVTASWVNGVAAHGVFNCPKGLPQIFDIRHIPVGWEVKTF